MDVMTYVSNKCLGEIRYRTLEERHELRSEGRLCSRLYSIWSSYNLTPKCSHGKELYVLSS